MYRFLLIILLGLSTQSWGQWSIGLDVTPSWKLNFHNSKITPGIRSFENGYGFSVGIPLKLRLNEYSDFGTGLNYEYTAFDRFNNGVLVNSQRFSSIQLPLRWHRQLRESLYLTVGTGANYIFAARRLDTGFSVFINDRLRRFQPYVSVGVNLFQELDFGKFEFGVQGRYYILDIWNENDPNFAATSSRFICLDLVLRYFL